MGRWALLGLVCFATSSSAFAQVLFDSNGFDTGYAAGNLIGQNGWALRAGTSSHTVQNSVAASGNAVRLSGSGGTKWAYAPLGAITPSASQIVNVRADLARTVGTIPSFDYAIEVNDSTFSTTTQFGLTHSGGNILPYIRAPFNTTTQQFDPSQPAQNVILNTTPVPENMFVNFNARLNYSTKRLDLTISGVGTITNIPFEGLTHTNIDGADFYLRSTVGAPANDFGYLDNYAVELVPVLEPTTVGLFLVSSLGGLATLRRRFRKTS